MAQQLTAAQTAWQSELDSIGRVTIKSSTRDLWWRVAVALALVGVFITVQYSTDKIGQRGLMLAVIGFGALIVGLVIFVHMYYGGKELVVDSHGIKTMNGETIPWTDVTTVDVFAPAKSPPAVSINLTKPAWDAYLAGKNAAARSMHKANKVVVGDRAVVLPSYLNANPAELASWLNQFGRGDLVEQ